MVLQPPLIEDDGASPEECNRLLDFPDPSSRCRRPVVCHVIWTVDGKASYFCRSHEMETRRHWVYYGLHTCTPACTTPGAVYLEDEDRCVVPDEVDGPAIRRMAGMSA